MKKVLIAILLLVLTLGFTGCFGKKEVKQEKQSKTVKTEDKAAEDKEKKDGDLGNIDVAIKGVESIVVDGEDILLVTFDFTNNTGESTSFYMETMVTVFQDGVELEEEYVYISEDSYETYDESTDTDIMDGKTLEVQKTYALRNKEDLITVEVSRAWSDEGGKISEEFEF